MDANVQFSRTGFHNLINVVNNENSSTLQFQESVRINGDLNRFVLFWLKFVGNERSLIEQILLRVLHQIGNNLFKSK